MFFHKYFTKSIIRQADRSNYSRIHLCVYTYITGYPPVPVAWCDSVREPRYEFRKVFYGLARSNSPWRVPRLKVGGMTTGSITIDTLESTEEPWPPESLGSG